MNGFPRTALIVDDDPTNRDVLATILREEGCMAVQAHSASACWDELERTVPDLILLDVILPDANGVDLCARIKNAPASRDALVILLSGELISPEEQIVGLEIGADDYIARPFHRRELVARVRAVFRLRESVRSQGREEQLPFGSAPKTTETARAFEQSPLRESHPSLFDDSRTRYEGLINDAIERRIHKSDRASYTELRDLAAELGFAKAGARDIVEIHATTLESLGSQGSARRALVLREESHVLVVGLMGHLLEYYRIRR